MDLDTAEYKIENVLNSGLLDERLKNFPYAISRKRVFQKDLLLPASYDKIQDKPKQLPLFKGSPYDVGVKIKFIV
jgi:hypothetical protein